MTSQKRQTEQKPLERTRVRFSVIIPLEFHRGQAEKCLRAWVEGQTCLRDCFEVIVACPSGFPEREGTALRAMMGEHDRFLVFPKQHDMALCEVAAREATGEVLFFTESHVVPEPDVLNVVGRAMHDHPEWAGLSCRSVPITHNLLSQIEAELYDQDIQFAMNEHPWRKVLDQCFVIRREPYFEVGGFEARYGHFAEWLLAARLYQRGYRVGYLPEARIHHYYIGRLHDWIEFTEDFVEGQMLYLAHAEARPGPELPLFEEVPEWSARRAYHRGTATRMLRMLWNGYMQQETSFDDAARARSNQPIARRDVLASLWRWSGRALLGAWRLIIPAWLAWTWGHLLLRWKLERGDKAGALRVYHACWNHLVSLRRGKFLRRWAGEKGGGSSPQPGPPSAGHEAIRFPGVSTAPAGVGFHLGETVDGETLRWSEPAVCLELPLAKGRHKVRLRWLPLGVKPAIQVFLNERPIPPEDLRWSNDGVGIRLQSPSRKSQRLGWISSSCNAPHDARALGLPLQCISWRKDKTPPSPGSVAGVQPLFFLHIRKTAGVSLRDALLNRFPGRDAPFFLAHTPGNAARDPNGHPLVTGHVHFGYIEKFLHRPVVFTMLRDPLDRALSAFFFFCGHDQAKLDELKTELSAEEYAQRVEFLTMARQWPLAEFLQREPDLARTHLSNVQTRQMLRERVSGELNETHLAEALKNLEDCDVIGLLERLPESISLLEHRMKWEGLGPISHQNITRDRLSREEVDAVAREVLSSWNTLDARLYQRAREIFETRLAEMSTARSRDPMGLSCVGAAQLPNAASFTPEQPIHGHGWYPRERANGRWICWMGNESLAWLDLRPEAMRDCRLTCEFPHAATPLAWELLQIQVNGVPVEHHHTRGDGGDIFECRVPAAYLQLSPHRVKLSFICRDRHRPCDLNPESSDRRWLSIALGAVRLVPEK